MTFSAELQAFARKVEQRNRDIFVRSTEEVTRSMAEGSEITGAPGQPVDTGALKGDWANNGTFTGPWSWQTGTNKDYAEVIEYNLDFRQKSEVGGTHSRALTVQAWPRVVEHVTREVTGA